MQRSSGRTFLTRMGLRNIKTNRTMSAASVLVLVSCLMLIGLVFLAAINLNGIFAEFSSRNVIMVYLNPGLEEEQIQDLKRRIDTAPNVKKCEYISGEDAYQRILKKNDNDFELLDGADNNFLPNSFEVSPERMDAFEDTVAMLETLDPGITSVRHFQEVAAQLSAIEKALMIFGAAVVGILMLVSLFIISSTVKATMYSRQQEIQVMKSVGASPAFIRWPFLVEGIVLGILGSMTALAVVLVVYVLLGRAMEPLLSRLLGGFQLVPFQTYLRYLAPGFLGVGMLTGGLGSMLSISRYLKEQVAQQEIDT